LVQLRYSGDLDLLPDLEEESSAWLDPGGWEEKEAVKWCWES